MNAASSPWVYRVGLLTVFALLDLVFIKYNGGGGDWAPIWVAGRLALADISQIYQFDVVSTLQHPLVGNLGQRPFIYPPTVLLMAVPFSTLPFFTSLLLYSVLATALFVWASRRWMADGWLLAASLPVFAATYSGQMTLLVAALIWLGIAWLDDQPAKAGVMLAFAAILKPQLLVLAPIGLIAGRHWQTILAATGTAALATAGTIIAFGFEVWQSWAGALEPFQELIEGYDPLLRNALSPNAVALRLGIDPTGVVLVIAALTIPLVALAFSHARDQASRTVALVGGALLISPYAMNYELATLAPFALMHRIRRIQDMALPLTFSISMVASASTVGLFAVYFWTLVKTVRDMRCSVARIRSR